jgi:hypothetical protein
MFLAMRFLHHNLHPHLIRRISGTLMNRHRQAGLHIRHLFGWINSRGMVLFKTLTLSHQTLMIAIAAMKSFVRCSN